MGTDGSPPRERKKKSPPETELQIEGLLMVAVAAIIRYPLFQNLFRAEPGLQQQITESMRGHGFFKSHPLIMGWWPGLEHPVLIDGYTRLRAAFAVGIEYVPYVLVEFGSEIEALLYVVKLQRERRDTTDGALYRMCVRVDSLMEPGGKTGKGSDLPKGFGSFVGRSASAKRTAQAIGCHYKTVEKIRKIRRDGTPEIQEAVANDEMSINKAYNLIRKLEKMMRDGNNGENPSASYLKAARSVLSQENFARLKELGGDLATHVNKAMEMYIRALQEEERV